MKTFEDVDIKDRQSFIEFLKLFKADLHSRPEGWENSNLVDLPEAMTAYAMDIQGYYNNHKKELGEHINADFPSWRTFGDILKGARIYE